MCSAPGFGLLGSGTQAHRCTDITRGVGGEGNERGGGRGFTGCAPPDEVGGGGGEGDADTTRKRGGSAHPHLKRREIAPTRREKGSGPTPLSPLGAIALRNKKQAN